MKKESLAKIASYFFEKSLDIRTFYLYHLFILNNGKQVLKFCSCFWIVVFLTIDTSQALLIGTEKMQDVEKILEKAGKEDLVLLDIDDTIITGRATMFSSGAKGPEFLDNLKREGHTDKDVPRLISQWRLTRKSLLIAPQWPELIKNLRKAGVPVYGLTQLDGGSYGLIKRVESWRYDELRSMGITFTPTFNGKKDSVLLEANGKVSSGGLTAPSTFYKGYFMTGAFTKGEVANKIFTISKPKKVIFVDDRVSHVRDLEKICAHWDIPFVGIVFGGAKHVKRTEMSDQMRQKVIELQKQSILEGKWFEDEEAIKLIESTPDKMGHLLHRENCGH